MKPAHILIVEDQRALALALAAAVRQSGASSEIAPTARIARQILESGPGRISAMILDIGLPDKNGLDLFASLPEGARPPTIVVTAHGEIDNTIAARKLGIVEFLTKPLDFAAFESALEAVLREGEKAAVAAEAAEAEHGSAPFIGASPAMRPVFRRIAHACASAEPVLISGETGTGKTLAAAVIRRHSAPAGTPFAAYQPGDGEQADEFREAVERSAGGILLLEEIGNLDAGIQGELIRRWESESPRFPRIIGTSTADLRAAVKSGRLRSDLYYRLQVLEIRLPPLRERIEDLPALFDFFLAELTPHRAIRVDERAMRGLRKYSWPGNLRELRNVASFSATVSGGATRIGLAGLPDYLGREIDTAGGDEFEGLDRALESWMSERLEEREGRPAPAYRDLADELERRLIRRLLDRYDGKLARLASEMNANRTTLRKKLRET